MENKGALKYREMIRNEAFRYKGEDWQEKFHTYLEGVWEQLHIKFNILHTKRGFIPESNDFRFSMFFFAIGLMTYGRKDVIPFVLQSLEQIGEDNYLISLKGVLITLLPLPEELNSLEKREEILDWLETHYEQLTWDEEKEVFYLKEEA